MPLTPALSPSRGWGVPQLEGEGRNSRRPLFRLENLSGITDTTEIRWHTNSVRIKAENSRFGYRGEALNFT